VEEARRRGIDQFAAGRCHGASMAQRARAVCQRVARSGVGNLLFDACPGLWSRSVWCVVCVVCGVCYLMPVPICARIARAVCQHVARRDVGNLLFDACPRLFRYLMPVPVCAAVCAA
jgi:hypothetical protein